MDAFLDASGIESVHITNMESWCAIRFENEYSNPLSYGADLYLNGERVTDLVIPQNVTEITEWKFSGCRSIETVRFHENIAKSNQEAFKNCNSLRSVHISDIAKWCAVDFGLGESNPMATAHHLYIGGELVTEIEIPQEVTEIKSKAFQGLSDLERVVIPKSVTKISGSAFAGYEKLPEKENGVDYIGSWAISCTETAESLVIRDGAVGIADFFINEDNDTLVNVFIPEGVKYIGKGAFSYLNTLQNVQLPDTLVSIGKGAFRHTKRLSHVQLPSGITVIESIITDRCNS